MNRKYMPLILMLVAGAVTSIITFVKNYSTVHKLLALLVVLIIFYGLGSAIKYALDTFDAQNAKAALDEGEVIEKEGNAEGEEDSSTENKTDSSTKG